MASPDFQAGQNFFWRIPPLIAGLSWGLVTTINKSQIQAIFNVILFTREVNSYSFSFCEREFMF
jgi:hypothetical protein